MIRRTGIRPAPCVSPRSGGFRQSGRTSVRTAQASAGAWANDCPEPSASEEKGGRIRAGEAELGRLRTHVLFLKKFRYILVS